MSATRLNWSASTLMCFSPKAVCRSRCCGGTPLRFRSCSRSSPIPSAKASSKAWRVLFDPKTALYAGLMLREIEQAAHSLAVAVRAAPCSDYPGVAALMADLARKEGGGLLVLPGTFTDTHRPDIIVLAARYRLAAVYPTREFVQSGGMMSYGIDNIDVVRRAADYVDRILRGANPAHLPVQRPTKFELMINLRTAKALGFAVPMTLQASADEVIE
jgi:ABC transporter substrate binding protein